MRDPGGSVALTVVLALATTGWLFAPESTSQSPAAVTVCDNAGCAAGDGARCPDGLQAAPLGADAFQEGVAGPWTVPAGRETFVTFPAAAKVHVSADGESWRPVGEKGQRLDLSDASGRQVRVRPAGKTPDGWLAGVKAFTCG
jgi:hypothetical protein